MKSLALICAALVGTAVTGVAQTPVSSNWPPPPATRARIESPVLGVGRHIGTIESVLGDTLQFRVPDGFSVRLKPSDITAIELSGGTHTSKVKWTAIGLVAGAALGGAIGSATYKPCKDSFVCLGDVGRRKGSIALGAVAGGLIGAGVGFLVGARAHETWLPVRR